MKLHSLRFLLPILLVALFTNQCQPSYFKNCQTAKGHLIMLGGGKRPVTVMQKIVELAQGKPLLVIPMASSIPDTVGWEQRDAFLELGAQAEAVMLTMADSSNTELLEKIRTAGGIWFSGGDQSRLMPFIGSVAMRSAIYEAYENGAVISGTSAGTAIQSRVMITGDEAFPLENPNHYFGQLRPGNVITSEGLGLADGMIVDQHFLRRRRLNRLINILADSEERLAFGIDEATALWIKPNGNAEVLGESQVVALEKTAPTRRKDNGNQLGITDLRMHILPAGSRFRWCYDYLFEIKLAGE